jgi:hypothetical protein
MSSLVLHAFAVPGQGSLQLSVHGYGNLPGQLLNISLQPDGSVSMAMAISGKLQTTYGSFSVTGTGVWIGVANGSTLSGTIQSVTGQVQICVLSCSTANFVGKGNWTGSMMNLAASGTLTGTITFTNSPYPQQLPPNQMIPISGTWNAQLPQ